MKSVILTHKELQVNLFYAITNGMSCMSLGEGFHIIPEVTDTDFLWKVVKHHTVEGSAVAGKPYFFHYVNKGDYQMNDIRLGVTVNYLRDEADKFIEGFRKYHSEQLIGRPETKSSGSEKRLSESSVKAEV